MKILALARAGTMGAAALAAQGEVLASVEASLTEPHEPVPREALRECLAAARLDAEEVERVVLCGDLREVPRFHTTPGRSGAGQPALRRVRRGIAGAEPALAGRPLRRREAAESLAAATFFASPFPAAVLLLFAGEDRCASVQMWRGLHGRIALAQHLAPPHSPARLLEVFGHYLGLKPGRFAYDLAYLGAYGAPRHSSLLLSHCVDLRPDGSFALRGELGRHDLPAPIAAERLRLSGALPAPEPGRFDALAADLARSVVAVLRYLMGHLVIHARRRTGMESICLGGDFAWAMARQRLLPEDGLFQQSWVHPQRGPAALALGAALAEWYGEADPPKAARSLVNLPYLGGAHSGLAVEGFLAEMGIPADTLPADRVPGRAAELIRHRLRVGWFQGREESGTAPAGHRQRLGMVRREILERLADPRQAGRIAEPATLAVLADQAERYFEPEPAPPFRSAALVGARLCYWRRPGAVGGPRREESGPPDHSAPPPPRPPLRGRGPVLVLRVTAQRHPTLYRLLDALQERTGVPLVLAEPLAEPPWDEQVPLARHPAAAYGLLRAGALDALIVGNSVILHMDGLPELPAPPESRRERLRRLARRLAGRWTGRAAGFLAARLGRRAPEHLAKFPLGALRARGRGLAMGALRLALDAFHRARRPFLRTAVTYWRSAAGTPAEPTVPLALPPPD
jgi:carbamoyltransferase